MNKNRSLGFKSFITPQFGVVLFWLIAIALGASAVMSFAHGAEAVGFFMLMAIIGVRVGFETLTVLFQIHDVLLDIRDQDDRREQAAKKLDAMQRARELVAKTQPVQPGEIRLHS
jgi:Na+/melibiose symporter-like transporter